jgi:glutamyl-tRNA synthetase
MDYNKLANLLFPEVTASPEDYEGLFPIRNLPEGALVTRIGPSPTGFVHLGNLYNAVISERLARQSGGVFILRVEDTDEKREVPGAVKDIIDYMAFFGITFDEGATVDGDSGAYGPYRQRQRKAVSHSVAKRLVEMGHAYPCFCAEESLAAMRERQQGQKLNFGYYGEWAVCRDMPLEQIERNLAEGFPYVLRFRSNGNEKNSVKVLDAIRGELNVQENYIDFVLLKSDGIPTYHFAHVVDDHFMRTTHVVRGEEWLATLPMHVQAFDALGWQRPVYCHTAQLMKLDGPSKRKLSKRKDPELGLGFYRQEGYLPAAMWEYLLTVLNSNFEEWRIQNPGKPHTDFAFTIEKMSGSGALFDLIKLNDVAKEVLAGCTAEELYGGLLAWAEEFAPEFAGLLKADKDFAVRAIAIGRSGERPRKDFANWGEARRFLSFYYDETFEQEDEYPENVDEDTRREVLRHYLAGMDFADDNAAWFDKVKAITADLGYAPQPKLFKKNPELYKGTVTDISNVIRVALTGRRNSPDMWEISKVLGEASVRRRLNGQLKIDN